MPALDRRAAALLLGAALLAVTACAPGADQGTATPSPAASASPAPSTSPTAGPSPTASASALGDAREGEPLTVGQVTVWLSGSAALRDRGEDDAQIDVVLEVAPGSGPTPVLATEEGVEVELLGDGSAVLRDTTGVVGGVASPAVTRQDGQPASALQVGRTGVLTLAPSPASLDTGTTAATATLWLGGRAVESLDWVDRADEGGRSLAVVPTPWARRAGSAGVEAVWAEVAALDEETRGAAMYDQLLCHAIGAPDKASWNLEPWRPDVGILDTLASRCNPS
ncbi:DUF2599 domain-containing protein [Actinotalea sp. K2]|uniref:DUF2599 domain-containing protein n=1 Tax=Actinotalea sp. K2 TaxID=2939438 RepID=UPI0020182278|nr:DUF2599 domain-containing protein [Actinotalea sp. K2]MCL3863112.1 DUF2599 domain-containing protein [Actinotalea sp. K2]